MKEKLTKFQIETLHKIQPIIKTTPYKLELTYDDELVLIQTIGLNEFITTIFPKNEISFLQKKENGKIDLVFFSKDKTEDYIKIISNLFK
jgi:hypothetical protein